MACKKCGYEEKAIDRLTAFAEGKTKEYDVMDLIKVVIDLNKKLEGIKNDTKTNYIY